MRYVGFDVEVVNDSDQPLSFSSNGVYLRDEDGFSYRSGAVSGRDPGLKGRTMPVGERARGWVWFEVPQDATLTEILLVPTAPELRVGLNEVASIAGTPDVVTAEDITPSPEATATQAVTPVVTPAATEPPAAAATSTAPPAATEVPTSVIIVESEETTVGEVAATATPEPTSPPEVTPTPAIVTSAPTEAPVVSATAIEPGATVVNADSDANVRSGPSLDADVVVTIPIGSELSVTGPAVAEGNSLWWPVVVVGTGEEGYISEDLLSLVGG